MIMAAKQAGSPYAVSILALYVLCCHHETIGGEMPRARARNWPTTVLPLQKILKLGRAECRRVPVDPCGKLAKPSGRRMPTSP